MWTGKIRKTCVSVQILQVSSEVLIQIWNWSRSEPQWEEQCSPENCPDWFFFRPNFVNSDQNHVLNMEMYIKQMMIENDVRVQENHRNAAASSPACSVTTVRCSLHAGQEVTCIFFSMGQMTRPDDLSPDSSLFRFSPDRLRPKYVKSNLFIRPLLQNVIPKLKRACLRKHKVYLNWHTQHFIILDTLTCCKFTLVTALCIDVVSSVYLVFLY